MRLMRGAGVAVTLLSALAIVRPLGAQNGASPITPLTAHDAPKAGESRSVTGRAVRGSTPKGDALAGAWVVLHRVGTDKAGPVDSMRTGADGRFHFAYVTSGDPKALYFVSTTHGGVAYFTSPLKARDVTGDDAELVTFDTTSTRVPVRTRARHLVIAAPDSTGRRSILEVFELSNDSIVTRVAKGDSVPVWETGMLDGAQGARIGQADFAPDAVKFDAARVRLFAPFAPGLKQFSYTYTVPGKADEYAFLIDQPASVLEVLVEDPAGTVQGGGVVSAKAADLEGRTFKRWLAQDVAANTVVHVKAPTGGSATVSQLRVMVIITVIAALLLAGFAAAMIRRPPATRI